MPSHSFRTLSAQQGIGVSLLTLALLLTPLHAAIGDTDPDPRYISDDTHQILVDDYVSLLVLPDSDYGDLDIILQNENARIAEISLALATNAHFSLPEHAYRYQFNANTGRVEIFNGSDQRVLALPVDTEGLTPWVRVGEGGETRIEVDPNNLTLIEATLPGQPVVTVPIGFMDFYHQSSNWSSGVVGEGELIIDDEVALTQDVTLCGNMQILVVEGGRLTNDSYQFSLGECGEDSIDGS